MLDNISINYHASIRFNMNNMVIYFDPYKIDIEAHDADYIFITHTHYDHYSSYDIKKIINDKTILIITNDLKEKVFELGIPNNRIVAVEPNKNYHIGKLVFDTIPAYNIDKAFHKKENEWVGYVVNIDSIKYYIVGDSDITDELLNTKCDVIFIPVGGTYTMDYKEASEAVNKIMPKCAVPIHYGVVGSKEDAILFKKNINTNIEVEILV